MKKFLPFVLVLFILSSCEEDSVTPLPQINESKLREVIEDKKVDALEMCCSDCPCNQEMGVGKDFSFPGSNTVRIRRNEYDLNRVFSYRIEQFQDGWQKETRMIMYME